VQGPFLPSKPAERTPSLHQHKTVLQGAKNKPHYTG
jgi:hypothetical protein